MQKLIPTDKKFQITPLKVALAGVIAALYVLLTLPFANFSFGIIQFRLAEALTVIPAFSVAGIPGVFLGCLLANLLNPDNLGLIDILGGAFTTLAAAALTYILARPYRKIIQGKGSPKASMDLELNKWKLRFLRFVVLLPPVIFNALVVGSYLPYLLLNQIGPVEIIASIASIFLSQTVVIYTIGLALMMALEKANLPIGRI